jgi:hypothetical protein
MQVRKRIIYLLDQSPNGHSVEYSWSTRSDCVWYQHSEIGVKRAESRIMLDIGWKLLHISDLRARIAQILG